MNEWNHVKSVASIKDTHVKEGIISWDKIKNRLGYLPDVKPKYLLDGNPDVWPAEVT